MVQLIVALDQPTFEAAFNLVDRTSDEVSWYKVGYKAFYQYGDRIIDVLRSRRKFVFLDLKLHDIPNTVAGAIHSLARYEPAMMTVHAAGGGAMLSAAAAARDQHAPGMRLVAVTLLTSLTAFDLREDGVDKSPEELAVSRAQAALRCGIDGVVCAVSEAAAIRTATNRQFLIVTPGIRPRGAEQSDQQRVATPTDAARAGADFIVVGRPISNAFDPKHAARAILVEMRAAG